MKEQVKDFECLMEQQLIKLNPLQKADIKTNF